jgi:[CysO sulfur-carrier protein]-S-L-cysteine hydrolase
MVNSSSGIGINVEGRILVESGQRVAEAVEIPAAIRDAMVAHARDEYPKEACGLLAGRGGRFERVFRMRNADDSAMTYRLEPRDQLAVFREIEDNGLELAGIYHSHTHSEAYPSETDRRQAFYPEALYVLVSLADRSNPTVRAFSIHDGEAEERETRFS